MLIRALAAGGVIALVLCAFGAQFTYVAIRDGKQLEISCADYIARRPDARWLKLTDCEYDFEHLAYEEDQAGDKYTHIYLPLRAVGDDSLLTNIVVKRSDEAIRNVVWGLEHGESRPIGIDRVMMDLGKPTEGLVEFGLSLSDKERGELGKLGLGLTKDFVLIDDARQPQLAAGIIMLAIGLSGLGVLGWLIIRQLRKPKTPPQQPPFFGPMNPMNPMGPGFPNSPVASFERKI
jgi:hypothetical protein